jgi:hypothetical protein
MTSTRSRGVAYSGVVLVGAGAVFGAMMFAFSPASSAAFPAAPQFPAHTTAAPGEMGDMPGMDHGSAGTPAGSPSPTTTDSPWRAHDDSGTKPHDHGAPARPVDRPLAPVLGVFGGGASAVMLSAGLLRRRDRARSEARQTARDARKGQK